MTNNLPAQLTSFVGRRTELAQLSILMNGSRLVTVTGTGGSRKTRIAIAAAEARADRHGSGIWYVEFTSIGPAASAADRIAEALAVQVSPATARLS